jgi:hypothetical protein
MGTGRAGEGDVGLTPQLDFLEPIDQPGPTRNGLGRQPSLSDPESYGSASHPCQRYPDPAASGPRRLSRRSLGGGGHDHLG